MLRNSFILLGLALLVSGCANLEETDRTLVNHPLMGFDDKLSQTRSYPLSGLGSGDVAVSQGCSVCAK